VVPARRLLGCLHERASMVAEGPLLDIALQPEQACAEAEHD
jgi:hypothetical protein